MALIDLGPLGLHTVVSRYYGSGSERNGWLTALESCALALVMLMPLHVAIAILPGLVKAPRAASHSPGAYPEPRRAKSGSRRQLQTGTWVVFCIVWAVSLLVPFELHSGKDNIGFRDGRWFVVVTPDPGPSGGIGDPSLRRAGDTSNWTSRQQYTAYEGLCDRIGLVAPRVTMDCEYTRLRAVVPFWFILATAAGILLVQKAASLRVRDPLACFTCGYNLTGSVSGVCPECGRRNPPPAESRN